MAEQIKFLLKNIQLFFYIFKIQCSFLYDSVTFIPSFSFRNLIAEQNKVVLFDLLKEETVSDSFLQPLHKELCISEEKSNRVCWDE